MSHDTAAADPVHAAHRTRAVRVTAFAGPEAIEVVEVVEVADVETPAPGPDEVLVRVLASSATASDSIVRRGLNPYMGDLEPPFTLGYDLVGDVVGLGSDVDQVRVGDRVVAIVRWGANADLVAVPVSKVTPIRADVDPTLVEPMVMTGATAVAMVRQLADLRPGQRVLVQGGSGGVGFLAVQAALLIGAHVVATASAGKLDALREVGATPFDYADPDVFARIRSIVPTGFDLVIDAAGDGAIVSGGELLADGGTLISFGFAAASRTRGARSDEVLASVGGIFGRSQQAIADINGSDRRLRAIQFDISGLREQDPVAYADNLAWMLEQVATGRLVPKVTTLPLEQAREAHALLDGGRVTGRLVLDHRL